MMRRLLSSLALLLVAACSTEPSVDVAGETLTGKHDASVIAFLGVPYAEPPLGDLRWRAPQPFVAKMRRRDTTRFAPACMQTMRILDWYRYMAETFGGSRDYYPDLEVSEDCLYLNVWTPTLDNSANLPVMVWLHGGSNISGWSYEPNYYGQALADKGVVVVSIAYRVGVFGFMSHPDLDDAEPVANFGLWDIIAALRWLRSNVDRFGGDPERVTLFGESSGAHNIMSLLAARPARGLFHRAIGQSTAGIAAELPTLAETQQLGVDLAAAMGLEGDVQLQQLRDTPADAVLERYVADVSGDYANPTIDDRLLSQSPWRSFTAGEFPDVALIVGTNADEWWDYLDPALNNTDLKTAVNELAHIDTSVALNVVNDDSDIRRAIARLKSADEFLCAAQSLAAAMNSAGNDTWMYYFTRIREDEGGQKVRAYHGAEYPYVFNTHDPFMRTTATDVALTETMQQFWISFAASGDPNSGGTPTWPKFAAPDYPVLRLGDNVRLISAPEPELCRAFTEDTANPVPQF